MGINSFWLFYIEADSILVSLINWGNGRYYVASIGPRVECDINNHQSILKAADESLSSAAASADISEDQEPIFVGLVIPSSWVGQDGKITKERSDVILPLLKELDLKPSGFMSNDEAIIEESNKPDDFPASFINLYLESNAFELSLIYLGKIKNRIRKVFDGDFNAQLVEDSLLELNLESTLPPQIYVYGQVNDSIIENLKNFPWVGKKNIETFLHFPEIKLYQDHDLINIFFKAITSQMIGGGNPSHQAVPPVESPEIEEPEEKEEIKTVEDLEEVEEMPEAAEIPEENLEEVPFEDLGFIKDLPKPEIIYPLHQGENPPLVEKGFEEEKKPISFKLPKINFKLPKLKNKYLLFIFPAVLIILLLPLLLSKANLILFVTPYEFDKTINITLDSDAADLTSSIIPVDKKNITVNSSVTVKTTGQKTVGNKATGEVTIFNKVEKVQNIPKGSILIDSKNQNFELINAVQIASSSSNFETGTMNFGQVKTVISASDIGPEFNISKDSVLRFKDFPETSIVVKSNVDFTGGTKDQISAVSQQDKVNAESQLAIKLKEEADQKINQDFNTSNDAIEETIQTKKGKTELNREVGEETDDLTASAESTVSVFVFKNELKDKILAQFLSKETGYSDSEINPDSFVFTLKIDKLDTNKATGSLNIKGSSLPKIDTELLKKNISGRTTKKAQEIIKKTISRVYDYNLKITFKIFNILPFSPKNIFIEVKNESP
ncbi:MAG: hypothetical protein PHE32_03500 [Candidatus Shapirobacteria bacterium]|nr:hypothetical protein [Candidatus Shapirobacteria bacterium]MDD4410739.1 hypothetical protein [Candidatus Shapirobacteria bacterium]